MFPLSINIQIQLIGENFNKIQVARQRQYKKFDYKLCSYYNCEEWHRSIFDIMCCDNYIVTLRFCFVVECTDMLSMWQFDPLWFLIYNFHGKMMLNVLIKTE